MHGISIINRSNTNTTVTYYHYRNVDIAFQIAGWIKIYRQAYRKWVRIHKLVRITA